jgi:predicted XRE-type DNA-binding protein
MARKKQEETVIEHGSGNVFTDLGFDDAEEMLAKAKLVQAISRTMADRNMTQTQLAEVLGIHQTKVSKLLRGITEGFSSDRLLGILNGLDQDIEIIIRPRPQTEQRKAHVSVALLNTM